MESLQKRLKISPLAYGKCRDLVQQCDILKCTYNDSVLLVYIMILVELYVINNNTRFDILKRIDCTFPDYAPRNCSYGLIGLIFEQKCLCSVAYPNYQLLSLIDILLLYTNETNFRRSCLATTKLDSRSVYARNKNTGNVIMCLQSDSVYIDTCLLSNLVYDSTLPRILCSMFKGVRLYHAKLILRSPFVSKLSAMYIIVDTVLITMCYILSLCDMMDKTKVHIRVYFLQYIVNNVEWVIRYTEMECKEIELLYFKYLIRKLDNIITSIIKKYIVKFKLFRPLVVLFDNIKNRKY